MEILFPSFAEATIDTVRPMFLTRLFRGSYTTIICGAVSSASLLGATFSVSNINDSGPGSFRQALLDANNADGQDTVTFQMPGTPPFLIAPKSLLPAITDRVIIDGASHSAFSGQPVIQLDGLEAGTGADGLLLLAGNSVVRGLIITRFGGDGIRIEGAGTNVIEGNFFGIGYEGVGDLGNGEGGITVYRSSGNRIGGLTAGSRNVISGGNLTGIYLIDAAATGNEIVGNYIGTDPSGMMRRGNRENGVVIAQAPENIIGGFSSYARNTISGNSMSGLYLLGSGAKGNLIAGNFIGIGANGRVAVSNGIDGIILSGACNNIIGGVAAGAANVISGNHERGVFLALNSQGNIVQGNLIGTDFTGTSSLGNSANGVTISWGSSNLIGGNSPAMRNLISGNKQSGVLLFETNAVMNLVQGNFIGVDWTGTNKLPNEFNGLNISGAISNRIGGDLSGEGNLISGNLQAGVFIGGASSIGNRVQGNLIGTDLHGQKVLGNKTAGIWVESPGNILGGNTLPTRNLISGNEQSGIYLIGPAATNNLVQGNFIGTDSSGIRSLGNLHGGIGITNAAGNRIGGAGSGERNLISGNMDSGIFLQGINSTNNRIQGNHIGTDALGFSAIPNGVGGVYFYSAGKNIVGGTNEGEGNLISGNRKVGIAIGGAGANQNSVQGNFIGTAANAYSPLGNQWHGIEILNTGSNNVIGGNNLAAANHIAYAQTSLYAGIRVRAGCSRNLIRGNVIFANAGLGIDLGDNGVNAPSTPGGWQSFPVIITAAGRYITTIQGTLSGIANKDYALDFYASSENDPSGNGEGFQWLGMTDVKANGSGMASFAVNFTNAVPVGRFVSATATDITNNTSEFSASFQIPTGSLIDTDNDGMSDSFEAAANLNALVSSDALLDGDGDGMKNLAEFVAGTDPNNASSVLRVSLLFEEGDPVNLGFSTVAERRYAIESSNDISTGWNALTNATNLAGTGFPIQVEDRSSTNSENRFYRVRILP